MRLTMRCNIRRLFFTLIVGSIILFVLRMAVSQNYVKTVASCDSHPGDVAKLCALLRTHQQLDKPRSVIYFLTRTERLVKLKQSISALDKYFNSRFRYPIVIMYDVNDTSFREETVRNMTQSSVFFQKVQFETLPPFIDKSRLLIREGCTKDFPVRYRHMCRFHSIGIYEQPIMQLPEIEYALRLDDDSFILRPIEYDIFDYVARRGIQYAYVATQLEPEVCLIGLKEIVANYTRAASFRPQFELTWKPFQMYYNNFEVSSMSLWRSEEYRRFTRLIDELGGIYYHRWGDAPIKTIAVSLFVPKNQTHEFSEIAYWHQHVRRNG